MPLIAKGQVKGVLEIFHRAPLEPDQEWLDFLDTLAVQAAIAIDNAELFNRLHRSNAELMRAYDATIEGWSRALDLRDKETEGHTQRVTEMALRLAQTIGQKDEELVRIRRGSVVARHWQVGRAGQHFAQAGATDRRRMGFDEKGIHNMPMICSCPIDYLRRALDIPLLSSRKMGRHRLPARLEGRRDSVGGAHLCHCGCVGCVAIGSSVSQRLERGEVREHIRQQSGAHFDPQVVGCS